MTDIVDELKWRGLFALSTDEDALRKALAAVRIDTTRGPFRFNTNHFPIQDYYVREVYKNDAGVITNRLVRKIFEQHADAYVGDCGMK